MIYVADVGAALNFRVVGGPSAPSAPKENTVWVNTESAVSAWLFSAEQPESPAEGTVWFISGTSATAPFNALKKNGISVYPAGCKQYVNGAWLEKEAVTWQNGAWIEWWNGVLYKNGDLCEDRTGGWKAVKGNRGWVDFREDRIELGYNDGDGRDASIYTVNKIDVTEFKSLSAKVNVKIDPIELGLCTSSKSSCPTMAFSVKKNSTGEALITCDISAAEGGYYVCVCCDVGRAEIEKIYLER